MAARQPLRLAPGAAAGFTLVELMVVLAVLVVVASLAAPTMSDFTANARLSTAKSSFVSALGLARSEAARRGLPALVQALPGGGSGNTWGGGWEVVADDNADGQAGDAEPRLRRQAALDSRLRLDGPERLQFRATGALAGAADQVFTLCRSDSTGRGFRITVTPSGVADVSGDASCN